MLIPKFRLNHNLIEFRFQKNKSQISGFQISELRIVISEFKSQITNRKSQITNHIRARRSLA